MKTERKRCTQRRSSARRWAGRGLFALIAILTASIAAAQVPPPVDTSGWECTQCPFEDGRVESDVEAGAGHIDDAAAKFGDFTGLDEDGVYAIASGYARQSRADGWFWSAEGRDLGLDSRSLMLRGGDAGRLDLSLGYDSLPHRIFDTTSTPFLGASDSPQGLPTGWVRAGVTSQMTSLPAALVAVDLGSKRETITAGAGYRLDRRWKTFARFGRTESDGSRRQGASFAFSALELARPIDYVTDSGTLGLEYAGARFSARIAYLGSFFSNKQYDLVWSNPYTGAPAGRLALAPDNSAHSIDASFNGWLGAGTTLSASASIGELRQDDAFLPYSINPALALSALPRASLDGKVDTTHLNLALSTDLGGVWSALDGVSVKADVRYEERDNSTPQAAYAYAVTDTFLSSPETNQPYGFERMRYRVTGSANLNEWLPFLPASQRLRLSGGWRRDDLERTLQEVGETSEDMGWGRLQYRPADWLDLAIKAGAANRQADSFAPLADPVGAPQNPLLRKYSLADREREFAEAQVTLAPLSALSLTASGTYSTNDYVDSPLGLQRSRNAGANLDANVLVGERASVWAHYGWENIDALQAGSQSFGARDWTATSEDTLRTAALGFRIARIGARFSLDVDGYMTDTDSDIVATSISGSSQLPRLRTRMRGAQLSGAYEFSPALTVRAGLRYEHFDADDWQLDGVSAATVPTLLSLGALAYDYDIEMITLSFVYRPGATSERAPAEPD